MKKTSIKILQAFIATAFIFTSCSKDVLVEIAPEFSLSALTSPSNMEEVEGVLGGSYTQFRSGSYYGSGSGTGWSTMPDMMSDNLMETNESLANYVVMTDWTYASDAGLVAGMWSAPYRVIANANVVIRDVDKFTTATNQKRANRIKGQALAIRAHAHFDLFRYFASSYDRTSTTELAVPYVTTFEVSVSTRPARLNNVDFYAKVFKDLTDAAALLADVDITINGSAVKRPNIDLAGVKAIQARVYLYAGLWAEAAQAATDAIALRPLVGLNQATFSGMYNESNAGEIIWGAQFDAGQGGPGGAVYFSNNNRNTFRPADEIAVMGGASGLIRSNDIRYNAFFATISGPPGNRLVVYKYRGKGALTDGNTNFPVYRTGEMYLIRAEARARNSQEALGMADLNTLRSNRINGYVNQNLTGAALLQAIADERRRELFAEGHRFFDLKRTTRTITRGAGCGNPSITPSGACTLAPTAREWALPIPEDERLANPNVAQNNGYF
jgi:hypothetical protein